jgi:hypothetical protein
MKAFDWGWNGYFPKWQTVWSPEQKRDIWRDLYRERLSYDIATPEELSDGQAPRKRTLSDYGPEDYKGLFLDSPEDSVMWLDHTPSEEAS